MMDPITWIVAVCTAAADVALLRPGRLFAGAGTASLVPVAIGVALLAGISTMAGHVVIFSLNRVRGLRLHVALALGGLRSEEHTSELQSRGHLVCRLPLEKKKTHHE